MGDVQVSGPLHRTLTFVSDRLQRLTRARRCRECIPVDGSPPPIDAAPDAVFARPLDINNRGQIIGDYGTRPPAGASSASSAAAKPFAARISGSVARL